MARDQLTSELDKQEFDILKKYKDHGMNDPLVDVSLIMEQIDKIQVLRNLKMIEENESAYDPELVRYEKLKARVLLDEPGAYEELQQYMQNRSYHKNYEKIDPSEETIKQKVLF
ncbi:hypothetical protein IMG5_156220 [Ichthyophthirius multifiliis]|uniref:Uncharacterized protein n=1 Tax=Ichthyophthirius multifiliis TaxID=5932 RepID=G0QZF1_ICHMU|nr:hypothetical protein IMG5_156220 [Ichthyophthirius multifiliis]EGR29404.1 hypothetical protein IMG5_156220 [Ichthyophthirius multifiliis]|eukprot:XP_004030640.1 hypothetical protein IMG5_156220 [Ichthyophthirius multifiliis]